MIARTALLTASGRHPASRTAARAFGGGDVAKGTPHPPACLLTRPLPLP